MAYYSKCMRELREGECLLQAEVAKALGIPLATYSAYETGRRKPSDKNKYKIAKFFHVSVEELFFSEFE